jgi:hypothetical protein
MRARSSSSCHRSPRTPLRSVLSNKLVVNAVCAIFRGPAAAVVGGHFYRVKWAATVTRTGSWLQLLRARPGSPGMRSGFPGQCNRDHGCVYTRGCFGQCCIPIAAGTRQHEVYQSICRCMFIVWSRHPCNPTTTRGLAGGGVAVLFSGGRTRGVAPARARIWPCCLAAPLMPADPPPTPLLPPPSPSHRKIGKTTELHESCVRCEIAHSMGQTSAATACPPVCMDRSFDHTAGGYPWNHTVEYNPRDAVSDAKGGPTRSRPVQRRSRKPKCPPKFIHKSTASLIEPHTVTHMP